MLISLYDFITFLNFEVNFCSIVTVFKEYGYDDHKDMSLAVFW